ncbi:hypothetical protein CIT25_13880 [Mesorhizobium mediterraneum]|uniref:Uncharacterized protein n=1 Tax=Mesorhizobium mediterraneum TaxID=43617 RepID=A0AB36R9A6_9HYPH|nr:hypothetical protein CIT25_13880 [Mesorhizobium mediterraneum]
MPLAFLDRVIGWWKAVLALAMNCRLWRFYVVRRNKLILSANGWHCCADHARAQERNSSNFIFASVPGSEPYLTLSSCGRIISATNDVNTGFQCWPEESACLSCCEFDIAGAIDSLHCLWRQHEAAGLTQAPACYSQGSQLTLRTS